VSKGVEGDGSGAWSHRREEERGSGGRGLGEADEFLEFGEVVEAG
jgi:hypothetical protein